MLKPGEVKKAAKIMEADNLKFRSFLKNHADEEELDKQFLALHNELFADYDCRKCRNCCNMKPESCKTYPYTNQPERLWSLYSVLNAVEVCPVAFEIFERLKEIYRFKNRKQY